MIRQCVGMDQRLVFAPTGGKHTARPVHPKNPRGGAESNSYDPCNAADANWAQGAQRRSHSVCAELLSALPACRPLCTADRHLDIARWVSVYQKSRLICVSGSLGYE